MHNNVQVVAYQPPPGYALVPMAEVKNEDASSQMLSGNQSKSNQYIKAPFQLQATPGGPSAPPSYDKAVG